jgi:hypothetical protein
MKIESFCSIMSNRVPEQGWVRNDLSHRLESLVSTTIFGYLRAKLSMIDRTPTGFYGQLEQGHAVTG